MARSMCLVLVLGALAGCGSEKDPFAGGGDDDGQVTPDAGGGGTRPDANGGGGGSADAAPPVACVPKPKKVLVLGDSITECSVIGGDQAAACVSKKVADYVKANVEPTAEYDNRANGGAVLSQLAAQLNGVTADGPVLVIAYMGGNDLAPYIFQSDDAANAAWPTIRQHLHDAWDGVFEKLADTSKFPDGATVIMNTQYNPFDDCTAPPYNLSDAKIQILHDFNDEIRAIAEAAGDKAILVDQYTPFLGHGHHYDVARCPFYAAGATPYMQDLIHANAAGNEVLAEVIEGGVDRLYTDCTP